MAEHRTPRPYLVGIHSDRTSMALPQCRGRREAEAGAVLSSLVLKNGSKIWLEYPGDAGRVADADSHSSAAGQGAGGDGDRAAAPRASQALASR